MSAAAHLRRTAGIAQAIASVAVDGGICLITGREGGDEVAVATQVAVAIGLDVDYVTTLENETLLRQATTYVGHLAARRAPMLFVVTDAEDEGHADLVEMVRAIRDGADASAPWPIAIITTREKDDVAVHLSRALDIGFRDIHQVQDTR